MRRVIKCGIILYVSKVRSGNAKKTQRRLVKKAETIARPKTAAPIPSHPIPIPIPLHTLERKKFFP
ncbi:hypothetical protein HOY82DRAFT_575692 [Tuber indicum]|nr:hypothetical protein HOY82DRAFT_575692 [Tuber indicum]